MNRNSVIMILVGIILVYTIFRNNKTIEGLAIQWTETKGTPNGKPFMPPCQYGAVPDPVTNRCGWPNVTAAKVGCGNWSQCGGFHCVPDKNKGFCFASPVGAGCMGQPYTSDAFLKPSLQKCPAPPGDCIWGQWEKWGPCRGKCGEPGKQTRKRKKLKEAEQGGKPCVGAAEETRNCRPGPGGIIHPEKPPNYVVACNPPAPNNLKPPSVAFLPSPPVPPSLLGGRRPPKSIEEDAHDRVKHWQEGKNQNLALEAIKVGAQLREQQDKEKEEKVGFFRDYSKPDKRADHLLGSILKSMKLLGINQQGLPQPN